LNYLTLADVIEGLTDNRIEAPQAISDVVIDSRQTKTDSIFVALPGESTDGHHFVEQALQQGAIAAIIQQPVASCDQGHTIRAGQTNQEQL